MTGDEHLATLGARWVSRAEEATGATWPAGFGAGRSRPGGRCLRALDSAGS